MLTWIIRRAEPTCFSVSPPFSNLCTSFHCLLSILRPFSSKSPLANCAVLEASLLNNLGLSGFSESFLSVSAKCFCPFIDFLLFNYIHAFCVGSLRCLCMWDRGRNAASRQMDFWCSRRRKRAYEVRELFLLPPLHLWTQRWVDTSRMLNSLHKHTNPKAASCPTSCCVALQQTRTNSHSVQRHEFICRSPENNNNFAAV